MKEDFDPEAMWRPWQCSPSDNDPLWHPYAWRLVEIRREGSERKDVVEPHKLPHTFNVAGLYWRPWPVVHPVFDGP